MRCGPVESKREMGSGGSGSSAVCRGRQRLQRQGRGQRLRRGQFSALGRFLRGRSHARYVRGQGQGGGVWFQNLRQGYGRGVERGGGVGLCRGQLRAREQYLRGTSRAGYDRGRGQSHVYFQNMQQGYVQERGWRGQGVGRGRGIEPRGGGVGWRGPGRGIGWRGQGVGRGRGIEPGGGVGWRGQGVGRGRGNEPGRGLGWRGPGSRGKGSGCRGRR